MKHGHSSRTGRRPANKPGGKTNPSASDAAPLERVIDALGAQGDGIVLEADGARRHVPFALPGETVRLRAGHPAPEILSASPARQPPSCPHFTQCGGCRLQHLDPATYAELKRQRISTALAQRGLPEIALEATALSPPGRRRRLDLAISRNKGHALVGLHALGSDQIIDLQCCPIADPALTALFGPLRDLAKALPGLKGARLTRVVDGVDLALEGGTRDLAARETAAAFAECQDLARLAWGGAAGEGNGWETVAARKPCQIIIGGVAVPVPPAAFLQATPEGEAAIIAAITAALGQPRRVIDLFAGVGTLSLSLAAGGLGAAGAEILALDGEAAACAAYDRAARAARLNVRVERRDLAQRPLASEDFKGRDAVILDPPFAGAAAQCRALAEADLPQLIYVSCNPASFARDARMLYDGGWHLRRLWPVDQFLWSSEIELVAFFSR